MISGLSPREHGVNSKNLRVSLGDRNLIDLLNGMGYRTELYTNNTYLRSDEFGFATPFDEVFDTPMVESDGDLILNPSSHAKVREIGDFRGYLRRCLQADDPVSSIEAGVLHKINNLSLLREFQSARWNPEWWGDDGAGALIRRFQRRLSQDEPVFALFNFLETHAPYRPPSGFRDFVHSQGYASVAQTPLWQYHVEESGDETLRVLRDLYDGCIRYLDSRTKILIERLQDHCEFNDSLVLIAGDHGDGFGEPGECRDSCIGHTGGIEEELLHVPLVASFPGGEHAGEKVRDFVSLTNVFDTVIDVVGLERPTSSYGSLRPGSDRQGWVLSERNGITPGSRAGLEEWGVDPAEHDRHFVAFYESSGSERLKFTFEPEGSCDHVHRLNDIGIAERIDDRDSENTRNRGKAAYETSIPRYSGGRQESVQVDQQTARRLRDLGYR
jgi:arylsulfatase A-like enzyme